MSKESLTLQEIKDTGAIMEGHFVGTSGEHMPVYVSKDKLLPHTLIMKKIAQALAKKAKSAQAEVVVGPAVGGAILAQLVARELSQGRKQETPAAFCEKSGDVQVLKRGYASLVNGKRVLVLDGTVNTTKSINEVVTAVRQSGGEVVSVLAILNRKDSDRDVSLILKAPFESLFVVPMKSYKLEDAPKELMDIPVNTTYGHGAEYLKNLKK